MYNFPVLCMKNIQFAGLKESPCLSICVERLKSTHSEHFAIWVVKAPYPGGYVHHDSIWPADLERIWQAWQQLFSTDGAMGGGDRSAAIDYPLSDGSSGRSFSSRLMQQLGLSLWKWLFDGPIQSSLAQSRGIAIGQDKPLRLRLEIRDSDLIALPWEIVQPEAGLPAISLNPQVLFSRTTSDVDPLPALSSDGFLNILLVLGEDALSGIGGNLPRLQLEREAAALAEVLQASGQGEAGGEEIGDRVPCKVETLVQPLSAELIDRLKAGNYNVMFYAGHGESAHEGGQLFLRPGTTLSGRELALVLVERGVKLAVFNACWGAQPERHGTETVKRSSLAEVLIHHGVPAVLAMRDAIADREALSFIQAFATALAERMPVDRAAAVARQQLLALYKYNQPAWTLPVLYLHPEFDGELIQPLEEVSTELPPNSPTGRIQGFPVAYLRSLGGENRVWPIRGGLMRVGRLSENDLAIQERWVSQRHAEIFCRETLTDGTGEPTYFLRDFSRYGTLILGSDGWQKVHHQEIALKSGMQVKFGSSFGQSFEVAIERSPQSS